MAHNVEKLVINLQKTCNLSAISRASEYSCATSLEDCELDTEQYQLYREGKPVLLRRKAFDLLVYLVKHAGQTLDKDDLIENVWPQRVISDATLNSSIREVRQAIGDSGTEQRLIKTLYGKGYRFVGQVNIIDRVEPSGSEKDSKHVARIPCPYPGMVPFRSEDASHFYGREGEIAQMVGLLRHQHFMMVIGPSGSGKSSLVQAGLLPELARSRYFEESYWLVRRMRPGHQPSAVLGRIFDTEATADGPDLESVDRLLAAHPPARGCCCSLISSRRRSRRPSARRRCAIHQRTARPAHTGEPRAGTHLARGLLPRPHDLLSLAG